MRREYIRTLELSRNDLDNLEEAQGNFYRIFEKEKTITELNSALGAIAALAGFILLKNPVGAIAASIFGLVSILLPDENRVIRDLISAGARGLGDVRREMGQAELVRLELPFLEFVNEGFSVVTGKGIVKGYFIGGNWMF